MCARIAWTRSVRAHHAITITITITVRVSSTEAERHLDQALGGMLFSHEADQA
jgi:hypothetical protein